jgi:hypothetical protein
MIPMMFAIWIFARHGAQAAIIVALVWGVLDAADMIIRVATGSTIVEHVLDQIGGDA